MHFCPNMQHRLNSEKHGVSRKSTQANLLHNGALFIQTNLFMFLLIFISWRHRTTFDRFNICNIVEHVYMFAGYGVSLT